MGLGEVPRTALSLEVGSVRMVMTESLPSSPGSLPLSSAHDQGQSCQELQQRSSPGSYLDLGGVAGPELSMQGGLHL